jgi:hypothetical protein
MEDGKWPNGKWGRRRGSFRQKDAKDTKDVKMADGRWNFKIPSAAFGRNQMREWE